MRSLVSVAAAVTLVACATDPQPKRSFWDLSQQPVPQTEAERTEQCLALNREVARQTSLYPLAAQTSYALAYQAKINDNIAALQSRRTQLACDVQQVETREKSPINTCFQKCRELTSRTEEQCFDACK